MLMLEAIDRSLTTPMHPTVERLFDEYSRISAAGERERYTLK